MELALFKVLSDEEIRQIHEATVDILANCGVKILYRPMLDFLQEKGLRVDAEQGIVRFSRSCLEDALASVPPQFEVFDREGRFAFLLGDRKPKIAAGHNAVFWVDSDTGQTRPSTVADVELFARICQELECIDAIGIPVMPQDVPDPKATLLYGVRAVIEVTKGTIAADLIKQIGPRGETYLTVEHTLSRLRSGEYVRPRLAVRGPRAAWEAQGAKDTYQRAREMVKQYARRPAPPLPEGIRAKLAEIVASF